MATPSPAPTQTAGPAPPTPSSTPPILSSASASSVEATCAAHALTPAQFHALRERARGASELAYCPYSGFRVGAALLLNNNTNNTNATAARAAGIIITGANVENASFPVGTCAERVALCRAITDDGGGDPTLGGSANRLAGGFKALAVSTYAAAPASPCGMCRQCLREFCDLSMPVIMFDKDDNYSVMRLQELLPLSFGPEMLGVAGPSRPAAGQA